MTDEHYRRALAAQAEGRYADAVQLLEQASAAGHVASMTLLGGQLLGGRGAPPDPPRGLRMLLKAADLGGAYACSLVAAVMASGVLGPVNWPGAFEYLQRSAELGYASARDQLRILADPDASPGQATDADWGALKRRIDLNAWRAPPPLRPLSSDPVIGVSERFAPPVVCAWIIAKARERLAPAQVFDVGANRPVQKTSRTNSFAGFDLIGSDLVVLLIRERAAALAGAEVQALEAPQALHYEVGQEFTPHFDFLESDVAGHVRSLDQRGQRVATVLVYLNEAFEGGETDFPLLGLKFRGRPGDALIFRNVGADGQPDRRLLHAGLAPTSGEKWLLSQWVRDKTRRS